LVAAHESLGAVDRLYGWARSLTKFCDEAFGAKVEELQRRHPDLHRARNLHEHREGYLAEPRDRQADGRLSGAVAYRFTDGGSFRVELMGATGSENVDVDLTAAIADSFVLAWETTKAVDRAIDALIREPGDVPPDFGYLHAIQAEDGSFHLSETPPAGYEP
jgi:hypothetical protein